MSGLLGSLYVDVGINNKMGTEITSISGGLVALENKMKSAAGSMATSFDGTLTKLKQMPNEVKYLGAALSLGLTAPLVAFGTTAVSTFSTFDDTMREVAAVTGATGPQFQALTDLAREMGETTSFKASEAAEAMTYLGMAGFDTNDILSSLPATLALARSGVLDLGSAADIMSNVMTIFGLSVEDASHTADVLAKVAHTTNTDVLQLGEAMTYAGPVAKTFGLSMEMTAAAMGFLGNAGIQASMAGTTLRGILQELVAPTKASQEIFAKYGLTMDDLNPKLHSLDAIFKVLKESGMSDAEMFQVFGQRAGPGLQALLGQGIDELGNYALSLDDIDGYAEKAAKTMDEGFGGAVRRMNSALESFSITIGSRLAVVLNPFVDLLTYAAAEFASMNSVGQTAIIVLGGLLAIVGPLVLGMAALPMIVEGVGLAMGFLGTSTAAVVAGLSSIALPVTAVVAALYLIEEETGLVTDAFNFLYDAATVLWYGFGDIISSVIGTATMVWNTFIDLLRNSPLAGIADSLAAPFETVGGWLSDFVQDVHSVAENYRTDQEDIQDATEDTGYAIDDTSIIAGEAYTQWGKSAWEMSDDVIQANEAAVGSTEEAATQYKKAVADLMSDVQTSMTAGIEYMSKGIDLSDLQRGIRTVNDELIILNDQNQLVKVSADGAVTSLSDMGMVTFETTRGGVTIFTDGLDNAGKSADYLDNIVNKMGNDVIILDDDVGNLNSNDMGNLIDEVAGVDDKVNTTHQDVITWDEANARANQFDFSNLTGEVEGVDSQVNTTTSDTDTLNFTFGTTNGLPFGTLHGNLDLTDEKIGNNTTSTEGLNSTLNITNLTPFGTLFGNLTTGGVHVDTLKGKTDIANTSMSTLGNFSFSTTTSLGNIWTKLDNIYDKAKTTIAELLKVGSSSGGSTSTGGSGTSGITSSGGSGTGESNVKIVSTTNKNTVNNNGDKLSTAALKAVGLA